MFNSDNIKDKHKINKDIKEEKIKLFFLIKRK